MIFKIIINIKSHSYVSIQMLLANKESLLAGICGVVSAENSTSC